MNGHEDNSARLNIVRWISAKLGRSRVVIQCKLRAIRIFILDTPFFGKQISKKSSMMGSIAQELDFGRLQDLFTYTKEPQEIWYISVAVVLEVNGHDEKVEALWRYITHKHQEDASLLNMARRLREAFLKTCALAGFPKGIQCLSALRKVINETRPDLGKTLESDRSMRDSLSAEATEKRGEDFFRRIYQQHTDPIIQSMRLSSGGDLDQFALYSVYGELMSETSILSAKETGLLEFTACYASMSIAQAKGHMHGAKNLGASKEEILGAVRLVDEMMPYVQPAAFNSKAFPFLEKVKDW